MRNALMRLSALPLTGLALMTGAHATTLEAPPVVIEGDRIEGVQPTLEESRQSLTRTPGGVNVIDVEKGDPQQNTLSDALALQPRLASHMEVYRGTNAVD